MVVVYVHVTPIVCTSYTRVYDLDHCVCVLAGRIDVSTAVPKKTVFGGSVVTTVLIVVKMASIVLAGAVIVVVEFTA